MGLEDVRLHVRDTPLLASKSTPGGFDSRPRHQKVRRMMDETTPDAVAMLQWMHACVVHSENHGDVPRIGSDEVLAVLRATQDERARHAEEVAALRDQLREVTAGSGTESVSKPRGEAIMSERKGPVEGAVYRHPRSGEEVFVDHVTDAEVYLRVTDGNGGLIRACRVPRVTWWAIREEIMSKAKTERYVVTVPIAGAMTVEVPAGADPDDIFSAALDAHAKRQEECDVEWEFHEEIVSGNVLHASTNEWSYEKA